AADVDLAIKERELYAKIGLPDGPRPSMGFDPNVANIRGLRLRREQCEGYSAKGEEQIEKALSRLRHRGKKEDFPFPDYLNDLVSEAEETLEKAAARALDVAKGQE